MGRFSRKEMEDAWQSYCQINDEASKKEDWSHWASKFTEDAHYIEHAYGEFHGREAIQEWIAKVMAPFPQMDFPMDWTLIDEDKGWVVFQCQNRLEHPSDPGGDPFQFPSWSLIKYAGDHLWNFEEDMYNPREAGDVLKAWIAAGGKFRSPELVKMEK